MTGKRLGKTFLTDGLRLSDTTEGIGEQRAFYTQAKRRRALTPIRQISTDIYTSASIDIEHVVRGYSQHADPDMEKYACEQALDCLYAIYKVCQHCQIKC
jgi:hypothetical protein